MNTQAMSIGIVGALAFAGVATTARAEPGSPSSHGSIAAPVALVGTAFTYQGQLKQNGTPKNGPCEMNFRVFDAATNGNQVGGVVTQTVTITNGLFTIALDFGAGVFTGDARWLETQVRCPPGGGMFILLYPRQAITAAPYSLFAGNANLLEGQHASAFSRSHPTTQQIALLKWYDVISGTHTVFGVGSSPWGIAFDGANMWVTNDGGNSVSVLRASDGFRVMTPTTGLSPGSIAYDGANMWIVNASNVSVLRASDGFHVMTSTAGSRPAGIAFDGVNMWVANYLGNTVSVLRASDGVHIMTPTVGTNPEGIAFDGANMWVANSGSDNLSVLRASDGFRVMTTTAGLHPWALAFDGGNMWVTNVGSNNVSVLRVSDGYHIFTPTVGSAPQGIAFDGANMWVANFLGANVSVLRASDGFHIVTPTVGPGPNGVAFDGANVWVTSYFSGTVTKR